MAAFPVLVVDGHGIAVKKDGGMFEPDESRKDVFLKVEGGHSTCTVTVPAEVAYSVWANGRRFYLVPVGGDVERPEDV
jgi:hypothetical protein